MVPTALAGDLEAAVGTSGRMCIQLKAALPHRKLSSDQVIARIARNIAGKSRGFRLFLQRPRICASGTVRGEKYQYTLQSDNVKDMKRVGRRRFIRKLRNVAGARRREHRPAVG